MKKRLSGVTLKLTVDIKRPAENFCNTTSQKQGSWRNGSALDSSHLRE